MKVYVNAFHEHWLGLAKLRYFDFSCYLCVFDHTWRFNVYATTCFYNKEYKKAICNFN